ncbi:phage tail protein [Microbacterium timonense]|uniref:phage tail protein n=1 Tax=Microbacterium timonense TaxID=2086576 RepID=UPI000D103DBB|nr:hypothetical protein [Microbacterium timonense]
MASDAFYEAYVAVVPTAKGFEKSLNQQIAGDVRGSGATAGTTFFGGMQGSLKSLLLKTGGVLAGIGGASLIADGFANAINDASTYQQATEAVEDVFGKLGADAIQAFAEGGAETVGQSMNDILQSSSILGLIGKNAGLAGKDLTEFTTSLITLGADLSAFANTTPEDAVAAIMSGFRGEADPLEKYGVFLNDAALRQKALELGIYDGNGALTAQQRILAAYGLIMDSTTAQQGTFAAQSDTLAGQQASMAAGWENISTKIGTAFLPTAEKLSAWFLEDGIPALEDFSEWLNKPETQQGIEDLGGLLTELGNFVRDAGKAFMDTWGMVSAAVDLFNGVSFDEIIGKVIALPGFWGMVYRAVLDFGIGMHRVIQEAGINVAGFAVQVGQSVAQVALWFAALPGRVAAAVAGAGMWLYNTGRQIIEGLVLGITSMVYRIQKAITDTVGGAIEWAKDLLGIHSPSRVFAEIGSNTARGFAQGIEGEFSLVRSATAGMTSAAAQGMSFDGARIGGTLEIGGDGLGRIIDGRIYQYDAHQSQVDNAGRRRRFG